MVVSFLLEHFNRILHHRRHGYAHEASVLRDGDDLADNERRADAVLDEGSAQQQVEQMRHQTISNAIHLSTSPFQQALDSSAPLTVLGLRWNTPAQIKPEM